MSIHRALDYGPTWTLILGVLLLAVIVWAMWAERGLDDEE